MKKDNMVYIKHIRDSIDKINLYTQNVNYDNLSNNSMMQDAVIWQIGSIGEASRNISEDFKAKYNDVPWRNMIAMRNKVVHEYFGINLKIVWDAVKNELPLLKSNIDQIIINETPKSPLGI